MLYRLSNRIFGNLNQRNLCNLYAHKTKPRVIDITYM